MANCSDKCIKPVDDSQLSESERAVLKAFRPKLKVFRGNNILFGELTRKMCVSE